MMTDKGLYAALRNLGLVCRKTEDGEYRVNFRGGTEATAYYTNDRVDALETGRAMLAQRKATDGKTIYGDREAYEAVTGKDYDTRTKFRPDGSPVS